MIHDLILRAFFFHTPSNADPSLSHATNLHGGCKQECVCTVLTLLFPCSHTVVHVQFIARPKGYSTLLRMFKLLLLVNHC